MKKPHKVKVQFEDSMNTKKTRSFATKQEADAFIEGIELAGMVDGMNGLSIEYTVGNNGCK
jgi:dsDNA-binding SOS-regulon protein